MQSSAREFAEFNGLLGSVVERGLPLPPALRLMAGVVRDRRLSDGLTGVARDLADGMSLPDAMAKHPASFPPDYCALVRAGADSGRLTEVLRTAQIHHTLRARLKARLGRLVIYVFCGAAIGEIVLGIAVLLARRMIDFNEQILVQLEMHERPEVWDWTSAAVSQGWLLLVIWPALLAFLSAGYWLSQRWTLFPWVGDLLPAWRRIQKSRDLALFCCALGQRLRAGAPLEDALVSGRDAVANRKFRRYASSLLTRTREGESLSTALYYVPYFPKTLAWGVSLAEENGELPRTIDTFADLYTREMEQSFEVLADLLTPIGMLLVGNLALFAALLVLTPFITMIRVTQMLR